MPQYKTLVGLALIIVLLAEFAAIMGIFSFGGPGRKDVETFRGTIVEIHGKGVYKDMPAEVAPQGIGQDYVTLFVAIPLLLIALIMAQYGAVSARLFLAGVFAYFMLTYMFWLTMGMYNYLFLVYVILASLSFFAFLLVMLNLSPNLAKKALEDGMPRIPVVIFLFFSSIAIALMWLKIVVPALFRGRYPAELFNFTTLIVQGLDLAYFLPMSFVSALLLLKKSAWGYLFAPVYLVFLCLLMTALLAKLVYSMMQGIAVPVPAMIFIGVLLVSSVALASVTLRSSWD